MTEHTEGPALHEVKMHLHPPADPGVGIVVSNEKCTAGRRAAGFVRHVAIDFSNLFNDDPTLSLTKFLSAKNNPLNLARYNDEEIDKYYELQLREGDITKRKQAEVQLRQAQKMDAIGRLAGWYFLYFQLLGFVVEGENLLIFLLLQKARLILGKRIVLVGLGFNFLTPIALVKVGSHGLFGSASILLLSFFNFLNFRRRSCF